MNKVKRVLTLILVLAGVVAVAVIVVRLLRRLRLQSPVVFTEEPFVTPPWPAPEAPAPEQEAAAVVDEGVYWEPPAAAPEDATEGVVESPPPEPPPPPSSAIEEALEVVRAFEDVDADATPDEAPGGTAVEETSQGGAWPRVSPDFASVAEADREASALAGEAREEVEQDAGEARFILEAPVEPLAAASEGWPGQDVPASPPGVREPPEPPSSRPAFPGDISTAEAERPTPAAGPVRFDDSNGEFPPGVEEALAELPQSPIPSFSGRSAESILDEGNVYFNVGQYALAIERYTKAIEVAPDLVAAHYNRANARTRSGDYEAALDDYNEALQLQPADPDALNNRGMLHLYRGNYAAALDDFDAALRSDPADTTVMVNRGLAHLHSGDAAAALVDFQEAVAMDDSDSAAHYGAAQAAAMLGNRDRALRFLGRALQLDPGYAREAAADPKLAALQGDDQFLRLLREAGAR